MIRVFFITIALLTSLAVTAEESCKLISARDQFQGKGAIYIPAPGNYCLVTDLVTEKMFDIHAFTFKSADVLVESGGDENVNLELNNHTLTSTASYAIGVDRNTVVKNGTLKNTKIGIKNTGYGTPAPSLKKKFPITKNIYGDACRIVYEKCQDVSYLDSVDKKRPEYDTTNVTVSHLKVFATFRGLELGGGGNVIRNSTIEVDGHTAVFNFGPNPIIENNTIIIHGKGRNNYWGRSNEPELLKGAIKLRDAKGGIIRNNKIIYKGGFFSRRKAPVAINLLDSKDVLIENNTIVGFEKLVRENGDTSFTEKNNKFEQ